MPKHHKRPRILNSAAPATTRPTGFLHLDPLSQILDRMCLRFMVPGAHEATAPWGVRFGAVPPAEIRKHAISIGLAPPPFDPPRFRGALVAMIRGNCWLEIEKYRTKFMLAGGDMVLLTRDAPITLRSDPGATVKHIHDLVRREDIEQHRGVRFGGGGAATTFLFGAFHFEYDQDNPLLSLLPTFIHVPGAHAEAVPWLENNIKLLNHELIHRKPGSQTIVNHLAQVLFAQAVRVYALSLLPDVSGNWLNAVIDPELATALGLMQLRPQEKWTVESLADQCNISRSAFSAKFTATLGVPPLQYLTQCRMRIAKAMLRDSRIGLKIIAAKTGYANESAFGKVFKRVIGLSPGKYRASMSLPARSNLGGRSGVRETHHQIRFDA